MPVSRRELLFGAFGLGAAQAKPASNAEEIVRAWMDQWTKLDGSDASAARFAELYSEDGVHQSGPSVRQIGVVHYEGRSDIQKMAKVFGETFSDVTFRIHPATSNEKSVELVQVAEGPWGGPSAAIEVVSAYNSKKDKKRYMSTGAAVIQIQGGKIRRSRVYMPREEIMEISP